MTDDGRSSGELDCARARRAIAGVVLLALVLVVRLEAAERSFALREAVELALREAAEVRVGEAALRRSQGGVERLQGRFDPRLSLGIDVAYQRLILAGTADAVPSASSDAAVSAAPGAVRLAAGAAAGESGEPMTDSAGRVRLATAAASTLPANQESFELRASGSWRRLLRNGMVLAPRADLAVFDDDYLFGVSAESTIEIPTLFRSTLAFDVELPLGRGRGEEEVTSPIGAQRLDVAADEARLRFTASRTALAVVDSYWQAVAARERLGLLERARDLEREILTLGEGLVTADQIPRAALSVTRARVARVEASVALARVEAVRRRVAIAEAAGLDLRSRDDLPIPIESLPPVPEELGVVGDARAVVASAIASRSDVEELVWRERAAELRVEATERAARRRFDLQVSVGWQGFAEGGGWSRGLIDSLQGELGGPLASVGVEWEMPRGNRELRGEIGQARAVAARYAVERAERERAIASRALELLDRLASSVREAQRREETARHYRAAVEAELSRLSYGDATMVDLVTTEEQLTDAELAALGAREEYARTLAALRFELGALVDVEVTARGVRLVSLEANRFGF